MLPFRRALIRLNPKVLARFSGGGHDDHHVEHVELNRSQNWVSAGQFFSLEGFKDLHVHEHHHEMVDQYAHLEGKSIFTYLFSKVMNHISFERIFFGDPHYTLDKDEPLMNQPHGYLTNDDPFDQRNSYDKPALELMYLFQIGVVVGLVYGIQGLDIRSPQERLYEDNMTAEMIEDEIRKIRVKNAQLEKRRDELKQQLNLE